MPRRSKLLVIACFFLQAATAARPCGASSRRAVRLRSLDPKTTFVETSPEPWRSREARLESWRAEAASQTVGTMTGAITGKVTDNTTAVLPGVTIVVSGDAIIGNRGTRTAVTDNEGFYRFPHPHPAPHPVCR